MTTPGSSPESTAFCMVASSRARRCEDRPTSSGFASGSAAACEANAAPARMHAAAERMSLFMELLPMVVGRVGNAPCVVCMRILPQVDQAAENAGVDQCNLPAADGAVTELRQEIHPALSRREREHVGERHETE